MKNDIVGVLGSRSTMLVFQFFMNRPYQDYSLAEVERGVSISYVSVRNGFRELVRNKVIEKSRQVGRARLYHLNEQSNITIGLRMIARELKRRG